MGRFGLSELQANAILEMRLYQLTGLERDKIEAEYDALHGAHRLPAGPAGGRRASSTA